jgi:hypothetical protein
MRPASDRSVPRFGLLLFALAAFGVAALFVLRPPDPPRTFEFVSPSPSRTAAAATQSAAPTLNAAVPEACRSSVRGPAFATGSLEQRSQDVQTWLEGHRGQQASVIFTDQLLTDAASRNTQSMPVRDVRVSVEPAGFRLAATAVAFGSFPIKVLLVPQVNGGVVALDMRELDTDGLPFFFRGSVEDAIRQASDPQAWGVRMHVDGVATQTGCAVVWGIA